MVIQFKGITIYVEHLIQCLELSKISVSDGYYNYY